MHFEVTICDVTDIMSGQKIFLVGGEDGLR